MIRGEVVVVVKNIIQQNINLIEPFKYIEKLYIKSNITLEEYNYLIEYINELTQDE